MSYYNKSKTFATQMIYNFIICWNAVCSIAIYDLVSTNVLAISDARSSQQRFGQLWPTCAKVFPYHGNKVSFTQNLNLVFYRVFKINVYWKWEMVMTWRLDASDSSCTYIAVPKSLCGH